MAFGPESSRTARATMSLGLSRVHQQELTEAVKLGVAGLDAAIRELPPNSPELAEYHNDYGYIVKHAGDPVLALQIYQKAAGFCTDHTSAVYASIQNNRGTAFEAIDEYTKAIGCYREAMRIDIDLFGAKHPKVAIRLNNIGRLLVKLRRSLDALEMHQNALAINQAAYGALHPDVASSLFYCGVSEQELGNLTRAEILFREAFDIYERFFGFKDHRTNIVNRKLEELNTITRAT